MKKNKLVEIRKKKASEIEKMVSDKKDEIILIAAEIKVGKEKNVKAAANLKKDVAQLLTILGERNMMKKD